MSATAPPAPSRPLIVGDEEGPTAPYPLRMAGRVIAGYGRGSKELGIPTANLPVDAGLTGWISDIESGIYFGWASLALPADHPDRPPSSSSSSSPPPAPPLYPMVMSIGYNPFYGNTTRSAEVHVLHTFQADFYNCPMRVLILGFVRRERGDYSGVDELVADIRFDCEVARRSVDRPAWAPAASPEAAAAAGDMDPENGSLDVSWLLEVAAADGEAADD